MCDNQDAFGIGAAAPLDTVGIPNVPACGSAVWYCEDIRHPGIALMVPLM